MSLEYIINQIISLDPDLEKLLTPLDGKLISLSLDELPNKKLYCSFDFKALHFSSSGPDTVDLKINGPLLGFCRLALNKQTCDLRAENISIHGDVLVAELVQQFFFKLDIDWEEQLAKLTGDVIAYQAGTWFNRFRAYSKYSASSLEQMVTEYLHEEARFLPGEYEMNEFLQQVDYLRLSVDRLEAKVNSHETV